jgi:hypothetical protein
VDPFKRSLMMYGFKDLEIDEYNTYKLGDSLRSFYFEGLEIPISEVFES